MSQARKIRAVLLVFLAMFFISGCSNKNVSEENEIEVDNVFSQEEEKNQENFPPTGKIEDVFSAINYEMEEEERIFSIEEDDAKDAVMSENEMDDFGEVYDQTEL